MTAATLCEALDTIAADLIEYKIELADDFREAFAVGGIAYDTVARRSFDIVKLKGKNTRKMFHVVITRLDNGRYEPLSYPA